MKTLGKRLLKGSTTRRNFLKTTAALAGMTVLEHVDHQSIACAAEKKEIIIIRGHHLFDMLDALGTGKSSHKTLGPVAQKIRANPKVPLKIVVGMDDICSPCEWWDHDKMRCRRDMDKHPTDNENSFTSDKNAIRVLGLKEGEVMNADDIYRLIKTKVNQKVFAEEVCVACRVVNNCAKQYEKRIEAAVKALTELGCVTSY